MKKFIKYILYSLLFYILSLVTMFLTAYLTGIEPTNEDFRNTKLSLIIGLVLWHITDKDDGK